MCGLKYFYYYFWSKEVKKDLHIVNDYTPKFNEFIRDKGFCIECNKYSNEIIVVSKLCYRCYTYK